MPKTASDNFLLLSCLPCVVAATGYKQSIQRSKSAVNRQAAMADGKVKKASKKRKEREEEEEQQQEEDIETWTADVMERHAWLMRVPNHLGEKV